ncbi:MAG: prepilin peptidase, partial [Planctomycetes bacterium]|nr:prepilin peptidase [Planctomycetota bacterium]
AYFPRPISPWSAPDRKAPPRNWQDRIPLVGWLGLQRESSLHGTGFWVRPMLLETLLGVGLAALYWWETEAAGLYPAKFGVSAATLHLQFTAHALLILLMAAASFIDLDETNIPDNITVSGTWLGLVLAAFLPLSLLPELFAWIGRPDVWAKSRDFMHVASPSKLAGGLASLGSVGMLFVGLTCWWGWCFALMRRVWTIRWGWRRAVLIFVRRLTRDPSARPILLMGLIGSAAIGGVWHFAEAGWVGLLSSLVGMAAGGGITWAVRVIGTSVLGREAMGFGDVTLMAMIGSFLGWQACLMIFFLAPFAGLVLAVARFALRREREIPYGPFLCLATLVVVIRWEPIWGWARPLYALGWLVPVVILLCLVLLAAGLGLIVATRYGLEKFIDRRNRGS